MGTGGKRPMLPIVGYDNGIRMGLRTAEEWTELIGVKRERIYRAKNKKQLIENRYIFADATEEEAQGWREARSISAMARAARAENKSYGERVAEKLKASVRIEHREGLTSMREREEARKKEQEEGRPGPEKDDTQQKEHQTGMEEQMRNITLREFASYICGKAILDIYVMDGEGGKWIQTIPSDSPVLQGEDGNAALVGFVPEDSGDGNVKVYITGGADA